MQVVSLRSLTVVLLVSTSLAGCSKKVEKSVPANRISFNDFEAIAGWLPGGSSSLTTEKAHSGRYSVKVSKDVEFSFGYAGLLNQLSPQRIRTVTVSGWVNLPGPRGGVTLVAQVLDPNDNNKQVFWDGLNVSTEVKTFFRWVKVSKTFVLPENVGPTHELRVYLWRSGSALPVYMDDVEITAEPAS